MGKMLSSLLVVSGLTIFALAPTQSHAADLIRLVDFNGANGRSPYAGLIVDASGNLFGTTSRGGPNNSGTVFEIAKTAGGYASAATTLASFNGANGAWPFAPVVFDADGNLFGTTDLGGANKFGTVFEIAKTAGGYASTPATLVNFNGTNGAYPVAALIVDANGNLFGTTAGGGKYNRGTVFEIAKTAGAYAGSPVTLVSFKGVDGAGPVGGLLADPDGNFFGATSQGGQNNLGTVFEIAKTPAGYASAPTTLVSFNGTNGARPMATLIADADGNLFGTTQDGNPGRQFPVGTVFEIAKTPGGYASTPTTLSSFDGTLVGLFRPGVIADANGNLFGVGIGGAFEIAKTPLGYASVPTILAGLVRRATGLTPLGGLIADANGNLIGTTKDGGALPAPAGTVFTITGSGFVTSAGKGK
jgi:uncharacterized repeat protein (TIGR03803 family)